MSESISRKRRTSPGKVVYWREQVAAWRGSGLSQSEYSRQVGISDRSLGHWKRRFDHEQRADGGVAPVIVALPIQPVIEAPARQRPIIINASHGFRLEIDGDFHPGVLAKIIRTLSRLS